MKPWRSLGAGGRATRSWRLGGIATRSWWRSGLAAVWTGGEELVVEPGSGAADDDEMGMGIDF
jgi:hypothetical protein